MRRPLDLEQARADTALGGPSWAAWRQGVRRARVITALGIPDPSLLPLPEPAYELQPAPTPAPIRPARMLTTNLHSRRPAPQEAYVPTLSITPPRPHAASRWPGGSPRHGQPFTRPERRLVLDVITRYGPVSRTTLLCHCTGMRLPTLDAVLADVVATRDARVLDGRYEPVP